MVPGPPPPDPDDVAAVEAARAAASAQTASEAAAAAIVQADVAAANANNQAADRMAAFEGKLSQWEAHTSELTEGLQAGQRQFGSFQTETTAALNSVNDRLSSIQARLDAQAPPPNQNPGPTADAPKASPPPDNHPPPEEPPPPAKKRAHRWI